MPCSIFYTDFWKASRAFLQSAMGLDPGIGLLHADTPNRDSLACDLMEVCRPKVDAFVLHWLQSEPLRKSDFWEDRNGNCRSGFSVGNQACANFGHVAQTRGSGSRICRARALVLDFQARQPLLGEGSQLALLSGTSAK